jgi:hypothetical protein
MFSMSDRNQEHHDDYDISGYSSEHHQKEKSDSFADYMELREIKGSKAFTPSSRLVGAEYVVSRDAKVEVMKGDDPVSANQHPVTVLVHRDEENDMRSIEVVCSCGKRTLIALEYDDMLDHE